MKSTKWMFICALGILMLTGNFALAQGHGNGHGKGHGKHGDDDDQGEQFYKDRDREAMRGWYDDHQGNLPPGLAKRDHLPLDCKNNWRGAARYRRGARNDFNLIPKTLDGAY